MNKMKQISVPIPHEAWLRLLEIKKRTGNSLVSIIRVAIDEYLDKKIQTNQQGN